MAASRGCTHHQRSSSAAVLDLDYTNCDARSKRRSLGACGGGGDNSNSVSPPAKAAKNLDEEASSSSSAASTLTSVSRSRSSKLSSTAKVSVRFDESTGGSPVTAGPATAAATTTTLTPTAVAKCHHLLSDDEPKQPLQQPQAVQRTHSNPEMELCPVCLARKECEILLKRTYSKVKKPQNMMAKSIEIYTILLYVNKIFVG